MNRRSGSLMVFAGLMCLALFPISIADIAASHYWQGIFGLAVCLAYVITLFLLRRDHETAVSRGER